MKKALLVASFYLAAGSFAAAAPAAPGGSSRFGSVSFQWRAALRAAPALARLDVHPLSLSPVVAALEKRGLSAGSFSAADAGVIKNALREARRSVLSQARTARRAVKQNKHQLMRTGEFDDRMGQKLSEAVSELREIRDLFPLYLKPGTLRSVSAAHSAASHILAVYTINRAGRIAGELGAPPASEAAPAAGFSHKIYVTPTSADMGGSFLIKFISGAKWDAVAQVLKEVGLGSKHFADNGDGYYVRIDGAADAEAASLAPRLAQYSVVQAVQLNRNSHRMLQSPPREKAGGGGAQAGQVPPLAPAGEKAAPSDSGGVPPAGEASKSDKGPNGWQALSDVILIGGAAAAGYNEFNAHPALAAYAAAVLVSTVRYSQDFVELANKKEWGGAAKLAAGTFMAAELAPVALAIDSVQSSGVVGLVKNVLDSHARRKKEAGQRKLNKDLAVAASQGIEPWFVEQLLREGADPNAAVGKDGDTALMEAAAGSNAEVARILLQVPGIKANATNNLGTTALMQAARWDRDGKTLRTLLQAPGIDVNAADKDGETALMAAAGNDMWMEAGSPPAVRALLSDPRVEVNARDSEGRTALMRAASLPPRKKNAEIMAALLADERVDVNARTEAGETALMLAAESGNAEALRQLLAAPKAIAQFIIKGPGKLPLVEFLLTSDTSASIDEMILKAMNDYLASAGIKPRVVEAAMTFSVNLFSRRELSRRVRLYCDRHGLKYDLKRYDGLLGSDFLLAVEGPPLIIKALSNEIKNTGKQKDVQVQFKVK